MWDIKEDFFLLLKPFHFLSVNTYWATEKPNLYSSDCYSLEVSGDTALESDGYWNLFFFFPDLWVNLLKRFWVTYLKTNKQKTVQRLGDCLKICKQNPRSLLLFWQAQERSHFLRHPHTRINQQDLCYRLHVVYNCFHSFTVDFIRRNEFIPNVS